MGEENRNKYMTIALVCSVLGLACMVIACLPIMSNSMVRDFPMTETAYIATNAITLEMVAQLGGTTLVGGPMDALAATPVTQTQVVYSYSHLTYASADAVVTHAIDDPTTAAAVAGNPAAAPLLAPQNVVREGTHEELGSVCHDHSMVGMLCAFAALAMTLVTLVTDNMRKGSPQSPMIKNVNVGCHLLACLACVWAILGYNMACETPDLSETKYGLGLFAFGIAAICHLIAGVLAAMIPSGHGSAMVAIEVDSENSEL